MEAGGRADAPWTSASHSMAVLLLAVLLAASSPSDFVSNRYRSATVVVPAGAVDVLPGDTLYAVGAGDDVVGVAAARVTGTGLAIWEDDPFRPEKDGLVVGEEFRLLLLREGASIPLAFALDEAMTYGETGPFYASGGVFALSAAEVSTSTVGFGSAGVTVPHGQAVSVPVAVSFQGDEPLAAVQLDLLGTVGAVQTALPGWNLTTSAIDGGTRIVLDGLQAPLPTGTHTLFTVDLTATAAQTLSITSVVGSLDNSRGTDAALAVSQGTFAVSLTARGDVTGDGATDILDFSAVIALIQDGAHDATADLHDFPGGNGTTDVRDLVVIGKAVLAGTWPDGLPVHTGSGARRAAGEGATLTLGPDGLLSSSVPLRALQGRSTADSLAALPDHGLLTQRDSAGVAFLFYRVAPGALAAPFGYVDGTDLSDLVGVTPDGERVSLTLAFTTATEGAPDALAFSVYPNPTRDAVRLRGPDGEVVVYDVLGRVVRRVVHSGGPADVGVHDLPSGQYFFRLNGEVRTVTKL